MTGEIASGHLHGLTNTASHLMRGQATSKNKAKDKHFEAQKNLNLYLDTCLNIAAIVSCILFFCGILAPLILVVFLPKLFAKLIEAVVDIKAALYNDQLTQAVKRLLIARAALSFIINITGIGLGVIIALAPIIGIPALIAGTILTPIAMGLALAGCCVYLLAIGRAVIESIRELHQLSHNNETSEKEYIAASGKLAVTLSAAIGIIIIIAGLACGLAAFFSPPAALLLITVATGLFMTGSAIFVVSNLLQKTWPAVYSFFKSLGHFFSKEVTEPLYQLVPPRRVLIKTPNSEISHSPNGANRLLRWLTSSTSVGNFFNRQNSSPTLSYSKIPQQDDDALQGSPGSTILAKNEF